MNSFLDEEILPVFCGSKLNIVQYVIDFVHTHVVKAKWSEERILQSFLRRSISQILADGDTLAFAPCPDRTLMASALLTRNTIPHIIVYHERRVPGYGPSTAHLALEVTIDEQLYMFDFGSRESRFLKGGYFFNPHIEETIQLLRLEGMKINCSSLTPEKLFQILKPKKIDMYKKMDWFREQAQISKSSYLHERMTYDMKYSVYREI